MTTIGKAEALEYDAGHSHPDSSLTLPDEPVVKIRPSSTWVGVDLGEIWAHRELLYFLMWRDLKVRYRQTILGTSWVILQPLLMTVMFTIFLGILVRVPSDGIPYPLFACAGLLPWTFFSNSVLTSSHSLVGNASLITKVYFSRMVIPASTVGVRLVDLGVASLILVALMIYYGIPVTRGIVMLPVLVGMVTALALAVSIWASALNVKYRDVGTILPVLLQVFMYASPILYPSSLIPERWRWVYNLNPMTALIEGFRSALFGGTFDWQGLAISATITMCLLIYAAYAFRRMEEDFADVI